MIIKCSDVLTGEMCSKKTELRGFDSFKGKSYFNGIALKEIFTEVGFNFTKTDLETIIDSKVPSDIFNTNKEQALNKELLINKLMRFKEYDENKVNPSKELAKGNNTVIDIDSNSIRINYHLILEDDMTNTISVIKFKNKKTDLKKRGQSVLTKISENMELFLLQQVGEKLYPTRTVKGSIIFLSSKDDKSNILSDKFEEKEFDNIVSHHFNNANSLKMIERFKELLISKNKCLINCSSCEYENICNYVHNDITKLKEIPMSEKAGTVTFTANQQDLINIIEGNYRVLAGAGSGKTTVIANRIVNLIKKGENPKDILLITYTTKGVEELKEKIAYWLKVNKLKENVKDLNIFTFNGFGFELIKKEYKSLGFKKAPQVLDVVTKTEIIKELLDTIDNIESLDYVNPFMNLFNAKGSVIKVGEYFDKIKELQLIYPNEVVTECGVKNEKIAKDILLLYKKYIDILKNDNLIDFSDQLQLAYNILSNNDNLKKYGFSHVMVDEFQDSATLEINTLSLLRSYPYCKSLIVVGDDSQSIFGFRGANQYNIIEFHKYFKNVKDIALEENFRSTKEICNLANYLNDLNEDKIDKSLISEKNGLNPILINKNFDYVDTIVEEIEKDFKRGKKVQDMCVITRNKKELLDIQDKLSNLNIPSIVAVSEKIIDNNKVNNIIGFSNFLVDTSLDLHFLQYLQVIKNEAYNEAINDNKLSAFIKKEKNIFMSKYCLLKNDKAKINFFINSLKDISKIDKSIAKLIEHLKEKDIKNIVLLNKYLNNLKIFNSDLFVEKSTSSYEAITLTTAHSSKGREFESVYISLNKFKYPKYMRIEEMNNEDIEGERKLLFVAITRAKKELKIIGNINSSIYKEIEKGFKKFKYPVPIRAYSY